MAARPIGAGEIVLMRTNRDVLFRHSPHLSAAAQRLVADCDEGDDQGTGIDQVHELAVILMLERAAGAGSHFAEFIAQLPRSFACLPEEWTADELRRRMTSVARLVLERRRAVVDELFERRVRPWCAAHCGSLPVTLELFRWAFLAVQSRAQWFNSCAFPAMVPTGDMFNHSGEPNAAFGSRFEVSTRCRAAGAVPSAALEAAADVDEWFVVSLANIAVGEQIFIQYCNETDQVDLALNHGILPRQGGAIVPLPSHALVADLVASAPHATQLLPDMVDEEIANRVLFVGHDGWQRLWDAFRLMLADGADANTFAAVRAQRPIASDGAAKRLIVAVIDKMLGLETLDDDALGQHATLRAMRERAAE